MGRERMSDAAVELNKNRVITSILMLPQFPLIARVRSRINLASP